MPATPPPDHIEAHRLLIADDEPQILELFKELLAPGEEFDLFPRNPGGTRRAISSASMSEKAVMITIWT
jgi:hypothetical protein